MVKWLRALFWLAALSAAGFAVYTAIKRRNEPVLTPTPVQPVAAPPPAPAPAPSPAPTPAPAARAKWMAPVDGVAPEGYPVKVNVKSGIYHVPGGRFYDRGAADRCYASAEDAEADGYRRAKA
jgi:hypothetical protein